MNTIIENDLQLLEVLRSEGWEILGLGFKKARTFNEECVNKELWELHTPWDSWLASPSLELKHVYWLCSKEF